MAFPLYFDEDSMHGRVVAGLRDRGVDCLTTSEAGRERSPDSEQLAFASHFGRAILTSNQGDYARLHGEWMRSGRHHAGIIILTAQAMPTAHLVERLTALQADRAPDDMLDAILFVNPPA